jgi:hypothetical protein
MDPYGDATHFIGYTDEDKGREWVKIHTNREFGKTFFVFRVYFPIKLKVEVSF